MSKFQNKPTIGHVIPRFLPVVGGAEIDLGLWIEGSPNFNHKVLICFDNEFNWYSYGIAIPNNVHQYSINQVPVVRVALTNHHISEIPFELLQTKKIRELGKQLVKPYSEVLSQALDGHAGLTLTYCSCDFLTLATIDVAKSLNLPFIFIPNIHILEKEPLNDAVIQGCHFAKNIVCRTSVEAEFIKNTLNMKSNKITVIPVFRSRNQLKGYTVDSSRKQHSQTLRLLYIGQIFEYKSIHILVEVLDQLVKQDLHVELVVVGPIVDKDYFKKLTKQTKGLPVLITGEVSEAQKTDYIKSADIVLSASIEESFGGWILEAWAARKCIIVAHQPVTEAIVKHNKTGLLAEPNVPSFLQNVLMVYNDDKLRNDLGNAGFEILYEHFTDTQCVPVIDSLITALVNE